jgi:hypothetical protein
VSVQVCVQLLCRCVCSCVCRCVCSCPFRCVCSCAAVCRCVLVCLCSCAAVCAGACRCVLVCRCVCCCVCKCVHVQVRMQLCAHVRACAAVQTLEWCVLRLLSQTRVRVVCRDTCMRARSILSWRETLHNTQAHYPRTLLPSIHAVHPRRRPREILAPMSAGVPGERGTLLIPACLARSLTTASRPKPCLLHPHTSHRSECAHLLHARVSSIFSCHLACAIARFAMLHSLLSSQPHRAQPGSTQGEPGGTNRSPLVTARACVERVVCVCVVVNRSSFAAHPCRPGIHNAARRR